MISPLASIHPDARIGDQVEIGPFTTIGADVEVGNGTWIGPNVTIMDGARIGADCRIFSGAVLSAIPQDLKFQGESTTVEIGDRSTIRECVTINRGTKAYGKTMVGKDCLIMAYVHIAHGLTVRATGGIGKAMAAVDAVPTSMSATEVRQALDGGVVKAVAFAPHAHMSFGTVETGKWWTTNLNPGTVNCPVVANTDALAALSDANRNALLGSIDEALDYYISTYNGKTMDAWGPTLTSKGIESISYGADELAAFKEAVAGPAAAAWIADNTAKGLPAQELYDLLTGMIGK